MTRLDFSDLKIGNWYYVDKGQTAFLARIGKINRSTVVFSQIVSLVDTSNGLEARVLNGPHIYPLQSLGFRLASEDNVKFDVQNSVPFFGYLGQYVMLAAPDGNKEYGKVSKIFLDRMELLPNLRNRYVDDSGLTVGHIEEEVPITVSLPLRWIQKLDGREDLERVVRAVKRDHDIMIKEKEMKEYGIEEGYKELLRKRTGERPGFQG